MSTEEKERKQIGLYFRKKRLEIGLDQGDVAKMLGYRNSQFVYNWESGRALPPQRVLPQLAKIYKISRLQVAEIFLDLHKKQLQRCMKVKIIKFPKNIPPQN